MKATSHYSSESLLNQQISHFQEILGIVNEGNIVSDDDFEITLPFTTDDLKLMENVNE